MVYKEVLTIYPQVTHSIFGKHTFFLKQQIHSMFCLLEQLTSCTPPGKQPWGRHLSETDSGLRLGVSHWQGYRTYNICLDQLRTTLCPVDSVCIKIMAMQGINKPNMLQNDGHVCS